MPNPWSGVAGKLLWLAVLIACALALIAALVGAAFHRIGGLSSEIADQQMAAVVDNAATGRALSMAFSDMDLVSRKCHGDAALDELERSVLAMSAVTADEVIAFIQLRNHGWDVVGIVLQIAIKCHDDVAA